ncbi:putative ATP-dependent RNA helicase DDX20 [Gracilariopsis chorda]|uniref:Putative ATP-dependent RNA helicase DDX20 n=1 Tax=Gracilariopsis chorda TaxID=448386 RepID=A0A2V3J150_9FLOR|nr:putative ATP-dependent RNA helicase DDX20 [Gracilariopsis chorda]|eukprot:PXF48033.1 putative ATP-dependent RNA helicase DDX20 [Gracilariopsis chorda]
MNGDSDFPAASALPSPSPSSSPSRKHTHPPNNQTSLRASPSDQRHLPAFSCDNFPNPALLVYQQLLTMPVSDAAPVRRQLYGSLQHWFKEEPLPVAHCQTGPTTALRPSAKSNAVKNQTPLNSTSTTQPNPVDDVPPDANHHDAFHPDQRQKHRRIPRNSSRPTPPAAPPTPAKEAESPIHRTVTETHRSLQTCTPIGMQSHLQPKSRKQVEQQSIHSTPVKRYTYSINRLNNLRHRDRASFPHLTSQHAAILQTIEPPSSTPAETFPNLTFADMHLPPSILNALSALSFHKPSPIQQCAVPRGRLGTDIIAHARSGTGKTLAFTIIVLETLLALKFTAKAITSVLILVPTRELVDQVAAVFRGLTRFMETKPRVQTLKGGRAESIDAQELSLSPAHIVIGTPGRVIALIKKSILVVDHVNLFVMDEADRLVDSTYLHSVPEICALLPSRRQTLAFSATYEPWLRNVLMDVMRDPAYFSFPNSEHPSDETDMLRRAVLDHVHQYKVAVVGGINDKLKGVSDLLKNTLFNLCITFINDKKYVAKVVMHFKTFGYRTQILNASLEQYQRERAIADIQSGRVQIVVATDLLARGVDFEACDLVIQLDVPQNPATYLHRVGRAGRYGKGGSSFLFYNLRSDCIQVRALETSLGSPILEYHRDTDLNSTKGNQRLEVRASGNSGSVLHSDPSGEVLNKTQRTSWNPRKQAKGREGEPVNRSLTTPVQGLAVNWKKPAGDNTATDAAGEAVVGDEPRNDSPSLRPSSVIERESQRGETKGRGGNGQDTYGDGHGGPPYKSGTLDSRSVGRGSTYDPLGMKSIPPHKSPLKKRRSLPRRGAGRGGRNGASLAGVMRDPRLLGRHSSAAQTANGDVERLQHANIWNRDAGQLCRRFSDPQCMNNMDATQHPTAPNSGGDLGSGGEKSSVQNPEGGGGLITPRTTTPAVRRSTALITDSSAPRRAAVSVSGNDSGVEKGQSQTAPHAVQPVQGADQQHAAGETRRDDLETGKDSYAESLSVSQDEIATRTYLVSSEDGMARAEQRDDGHPNVVTGSNNENNGARYESGETHSEMWNAYAKDAYAVGYREAYREAFRMAREVADRARATRT